MENDYGVNAERTVMLIVIAALVSLATHGFLMYALLDHRVSTFSSRVRNAEAARRQRERIPMTVTDAPPPRVAEERKTRVEETPSGPGRGPSGGPAAPVPETVAVERTRPNPPPPPSTPGEKILEVTTPSVPDAAAALPRIDVPKAVRITGAPEPDTGALMKPVRDTLAAISTSSGSRDGVPGSDGSVAPAAPPVPGGTGSGIFGRGGSSIADALGTPSARMEAKKKLQDPAKEAARREPQPAKMREKVDEAVVEAEKKAVRELRDEQEGKSFARHVKPALASWVDDATKTRYFRLTLASDDRDPLPVISKDIVFMLDASGSIADDRLRACRNAVKAALRALNTGDRFNIVAFRDKFQYVFPEWRGVDQNSLERADEWLSKLTAHGRTDVFGTLKSVMAVPRDPARPLVALMVTDGEPTAGLRRNEEIITAFARLNGGIVSVYMYGVKETANEYLMDMVSRGNRGGWVKHKKALFSDRVKVADEMPAFIETFRDPVLTDLSVGFSAASRTESYPTLVRNLYRGAPVEIVGKCPVDQSDIVFEVKGLNGSDAHEEVFKLSFSGADVGALDASVVGTWKTLRGYEWRIR